MGKNVEEVKKALEFRAEKLVDFAASNYLVLNPDKTQHAWSNGATTGIKVAGSIIDPASSIELLGVEFGKGLNCCHGGRLLRDVRRVAGVIRRLARHLPPGRLLRQLAQALLLGKANYAAPAHVVPRLTNNDPATPACYQDVQRAFNEVARAVTGLKRADRVPVEKLMKKAGLPSWNRLLVRSVVVETWKALNIRDGPDASTTPLGDLLRGRAHCRETRAAIAGLLPVKKPCASFVCAATRIWNSNPSLRACNTLAEAKRCAMSIAAEAPM